VAFLQLRDVRKSYATPRGPHLVLQGIDLDVEAGEFIAIVGYAGSGKTTLISLIAGLITPASYYQLRDQLIGFLEERAAA
jgi:nitrate/nitrite transport system ATP-binding protein